MKRKTFLAGAASLLVGSTLSQGARAQAAWPNRPIRLVVNFAPGSSPDVLARALSGPLATALGQPVTVENRAGGGGVIGADAVAKAAPDGTTFLMASGSSASITPFLTPRLPYVIGKDLVPVAAGARIEVFLVARSELPFASSYADFIRHAKANPGRLSYGSPGNGSSPHIAGEMLKSQAGFFSVHIPYRGSSPALQDLLGGQLDYLFDPGIAFPHVRSGRLRMLAVGAAKRSPLFPNVPTLAELGLTGFDAGTTHGFWAPGGTPQPIIDRMNAEINKALAIPSVAEAIRALGADVTPMSPAQFDAVTKADARRYEAIIKERKITAD